MRFKTNAERAINKSLGSNPPIYSRILQNVPGLVPKMGAYLNVIFCFVFSPFLAAQTIYEGSRVVVDGGIGTKPRLALITSIEEHAYSGVSLSHDLPDLTGREFSVDSDLLEDPETAPSVAVLQFSNSFLGISEEKLFKLTTFTKSYAFLILSSWPGEGNLICWDNEYSLDQELSTIGLDGKPYRFFLVVRPSDNHKIVMRENECQPRDN